MSNYQWITWNHGISSVALYLQYIFWLLEYDNDNLNTNCPWCSKYLSPIISSESQWRSWSTVLQRSQYAQWQHMFRAYGVLPKWDLLHNLSTCHQFFKTLKGGKNTSCYTFTDYNLGGLELEGITRRLKIMLSLLLKPVFFIHLSFYLIS